MHFHEPAAAFSVSASELHLLTAKSFVSCEECSTLKTVQQRFQTLFQLMATCFLILLFESMQATFNQLSPDELKVSLNISLKSKVEGYKLDVMVAIYENGLVTDCAKGENRGRILTNDFVVTGLVRACTIQDLPAKKVTKGEVILQLWEGFVRSNCGVVVFLQNPTSLEVFGAQQIDLPDDVK